jgi:hypothetical protein
LVTRSGLGFIENNKDDKLRAGRRENGGERRDVLVGIVPSGPVFRRAGLARNFITLRVSILARPVTTSLACPEPWPPSGDITSPSTFSASTGSTNTGGHNSRHCQTP